MARTIWKFPLEVVATQKVVMPVHAEVIHVGEQANNLTIWAICDSTAEKEDRVFAVRGTGHPVPEVGNHIGSVIIGPYVWHVFDLGEGYSG